MGSADVILAFEPGEAVRCLPYLKKDGLVKQEGTRIALTEWGMDVSNFVLSEFLL